MESIQLADQLKVFSTEALHMLHHTNTLRPLIRELIIDDLIKGLRCPDEILIKIKRRYCEEHDLTDEEGLKSHLYGQGIDETTWEERISKPWKLQAQGLEKYKGQAERFFLDNKLRLDEVTYNLIRVTDADLAHDIYLRIDDGDSTFTELSAQFGEGPEKIKGGLVGPVSMNQGHPLLLERLHSADTGTLIEPFKVDKWWVIVRVEEVNKSEFNKETCQKICNLLMNEWIEERTLEYNREMIIDQQ